MVKIFELNQIIHADCMDVMEEIPDNYFDLAIPDPPYYEGPNKRGHYGRSESTTSIKRVNYPKIYDWDIPDEKYFKELFRISKNQIIWGCNYYNYVFGPGRIIWDKCNGDSSFSDCEIAYCSIHDSVRLYRYMWNGMMQGKDIYNGEIQQGNKALNEKRIHPCQKPVNLYRWIFQRYMKPGQRMIDTHAGSGSSLIAANIEGIEYLGIEKSKIVFEEAQERVKEETAQISIFNTGVPR